MLRIFHKTRGDIQLVITIIVICLIWVPRIFLAPGPRLFPEHVFFNQLFGWVGNVPLLGVGLTVLFVILGGYIERRALDYDRLRISGHFFPFFIFIFLASGAHVCGFSPVILSLLILAMAMRFVLIVPEQLQNDHLIFFAAFLFGVASFFYIPMMLLMVYWFVAIIVFEDFKIRKLILALLGFLLPWIWLIAGLYLAGNFSILAEYWDSISFKLHLPDISADIWSFALVCIVIFIYLVFIFSRLARQQETLFIIRRRIRASILMVIFIFIGAFFSYDFYEHLSLLAVPMTIVISYGFHEELRPSWVDYGLLGVLVLTIFYSYLGLWL